jgi:hypothetical protein
MQRPAAAAVGVHPSTCGREHGAAAQAQARAVAGKLCMLSMRCGSRLSKVNLISLFTENNRCSPGRPSLPVTFQTVISNRQNAYISYENDAQSLRLSGKFHSRMHGLMPT